MKNIIITSLLFLAACVPVGNNAGVPNSESKDTLTIIDAAKAANVKPEETTTYMLWDSIRSGTELAPIQMMLYFEADTTYYQFMNITSELLNAYPLGDSLVIALVGQHDNNCQKASVYILNRYFRNKINEKEVEIDCDMDDQSMDQVSYQFTTNQDLVITTDTYGKGVNSDGPSVTRKEYWTILANGQFKKSKPDEENHNMGSDQAQVGEGKQ